MHQNNTKNKACNHNSEFSSSQASSTKQYTTSPLASYPAFAVPSVRVGGTFVGVNIGDQSCSTSTAQLHHQQKWTTMTPPHLEPRQEGCYAMRGSHATPISQSDSYRATAGWKGPALKWDPDAPNAGRARPPPPHLKEAKRNKEDGSLLSQQIEKVQCGPADVKKKQRPAPSYHSVVSVSQDRHPRQPQQLPSFKHHQQQVRDQRRHSNDFHHNCENGQHSAAAGSHQQQHYQHRCHYPPSNATGFDQSYDSSASFVVTAAGSESMNTTIASTNSSAATELASSFYYSSSPLITTVFQPQQRKWWEQREMGLEELGGPPDAVTLLELESRGSYTSSTAATTPPSGTTQRHPHPLVAPPTAPAPYYAAFCLEKGSSGENLSALGRSRSSRSCSTLSIVRNEEEDVSPDTLVSPASKDSFYNTATTATATLMTHMPYPTLGEPIAAARSTSPFNTSTRSSSSHVSSIPIARSRSSRSSSINDHLRDLEEESHQNYGSYDSRPHRADFYQHHTLVSLSDENSHAASHLHNYSHGTLPPAPEDRELGEQEQGAVSIELTQIYRHDPYCWAHGNLDLSGGDGQEQYLLYESPVEEEPWPTPPSSSSSEQTSPLSGGKNDDDDDSRGALNGAPPQLPLGSGRQADALDLLETLVFVPNQPPLVPAATRETIISDINLLFRRLTHQLPAEEEKEKSIVDSESSSSAYWRKVMRDNVVVRNTRLRPTQRSPRDSQGQSQQGGSSAPQSSPGTGTTTTTATTADSAEVTSRDVMNMLFGESRETAAAYPGRGLTRSLLVKTTRSSPVFSLPYDLDVVFKVKGELPELVQQKGHRRIGGMMSTTPPLSPNSSNDDASNSSPNTSPMSSSAAATATSSNRSSNSLRRRVLMLGPLGFEEFLTREVHRAVGFPLAVNLRQQRF